MRGSTRRAALAPHSSCATAPAPALFQGRHSGAFRYVVQKDARVAVSAEIRGVSRAYHEGVILRVRVRSATPGAAWIAVDDWPLDFEAGGGTRGWAPGGGDGGHLERRARGGVREGALLYQNRQASSVWSTGHLFCAPQNVARNVFPLTRNAPPSVARLGDIPAGRHELELRLEESPKLSLSLFLFFSLSLFLSLSPHEPMPMLL